MGPSTVAWRLVLESDLVNNFYLCFFMSKQLRLSGAAQTLCHVDSRVCVAAPACRVCRDSSTSTSGVARVSYQDFVRVSGFLLLAATCPWHQARRGNANLRAELVMQTVLPFRISSPETRPSGGKVGGREATASGRRQQSFRSTVLRWSHRVAQRRSVRPCRAIGWEASPSSSIFARGYDETSPLDPINTCGFFLSSGSHGWQQCNRPTPAFRETRRRHEPAIRTETKRRRKVH